MKKYFALLISPWLLAALSYEVQFIGLNNPDCLNAIQTRSDLLLLKNRPPASINGLKYRIESDIPNFMKVLRAYSYYDSQITYQVNSSKDPLEVYIYINPGSPFTLSSYQIVHGACIEPLSLSECGNINPNRLDLELNRPALSVSLINAELKLLTELSRCGYPLAYIDKRKVEVDMAKHVVDAAVCVQEGPLSKFGPSILFGLKDVNPRYVERRIAWNEGEIYDSTDVFKTQQKLLNTNLFTSVYISHGDELDEMGELPMKIRLSEAKFRQISLGGFYATADGFGASISWTHRNLRGMGEIANLEGEYSNRYISGQLSYIKPDFLQTNQSYKIYGQASRENIFPYLALTYRGANYIERKINPKQSMSFGLKFENIRVHQSATDGDYLVIGAPFFIKFDQSDDPLNPTHGYTLVYQGTPYQSIFHSDQKFIKQRFTGTAYFPLNQKKWLILALRTQFGSIAGTEKQNIPLPKLFLGGSEDDLRGYRYKSVSPLNLLNQPLGGRSAIYATGELRFRFGAVGIVPFADFGNVQFNQIPNFSGKWFKSVGLGLRYFAFFGPLRFDIGFPLDKRKGIDHAYQIYATVGQTF